MLKRLKALLRPRLAKVATKTFGYPVTFDSERQPHLGYVRVRSARKRDRINYDDRYTFLPSEEVVDFLNKYRGVITVSDVRSIDFLNLDEMLLGDSLDYGKVTITFQDPASALMFSLTFLRP